MFIKNMKSVISANIPSKTNKVMLFELVQTSSNSFTF